jgi:hypothetical protein
MTMVGKDKDEIPQRDRKADTKEPTVFKYVEVIKCGFISRSSSHKPLAF